MDKQIETIRVDKVPGSLEGITWRKSSQDYGVTVAVPKEYYRYAKPLMGKENYYFIVCYCQIDNLQQAEELLKAEIEDISFIPEKNQIEAIPEICSLEQIADLLVMTPRNAQLLAQSGVLIKISRGKYHRDESIKGYINNLREQNRGGDSPQLTKERTRIAKAIADKKELENAILKKDYCYRPNVERIIANIILETKSKINASSMKAASLINAGVQSTFEIKEVIDNSHDDILRDLQYLDIGRLLLAEKGTTELPAKTKTKSKRVGRKVRNTKGRK